MNLSVLFNALESNSIIYFVKFICLNCYSFDHRELRFFLESFCLSPSFLSIFNFWHHRLILYFPCPSPGINLFKEPWLLLLENGIWNPRSWNCLCLLLQVYQLLKDPVCGKSQGSMYTNACLHTALFTSMCLFVCTLKYHKLTWYVKCVPYLQFLWQWETCFSLSTVCLLVCLTLVYV